MGNDFDFHPHIVFAQTCDADTGPDGLVVRHIFPEVAYHGIQGLVVDGYMI